MRGFTLIELLIVLGIVALLASLIAIAVMREAKIRSLVGKIESNLSQVRQVAAQIYTESNTYIAADNSLCDINGTLNENNLTHPELKDIAEQVKKANGNRTINCIADDRSYCVDTELPTGEKICIDHKGVIKKGNFICSPTKIECE